MHGDTCLVKANELICSDSFLLSLRFSHQQLPKKLLESMDSSVVRARPPVLMNNKELSADPSAGCLAQSSLSAEATEARQTFTDLFIFVFFLLYLDI